SIDGSVEILGPGPDQLSVSGNGASRIFYTYPAAPQSVSISGITLTKGVAETGGAIRAHNVSLALSNAVVSGNKASGSGNGAGGVSASHGPLTIQGSTISGNTITTGRGGGIRTYRSAILIQDSTISGNTSTQIGGRGAGIYAYQDSLTIEGSTISANTTASRGGGINTFNTAVEITRSTISGNSAGPTVNDGGGIYDCGGSLSIDSSTVSENTAGDHGGGIYTFNVTPDPGLKNTIVANNTAQTGPDLFGGGGDEFNAPFSLIENPANATIVGGPNITGQDPKLLPLADNGGPTQTHALALGSPALDPRQGTGT